MNAKKFLRVTVSLLIVSMLILSLRSSASAVPPVPKNIIVMIGDGMGFNQPLAASYYRFGLGKAQIYNDFPVQFAEKTDSADGWGYNPALVWADFDYVMTHYTDSAAAATAMATGVKTYDAGIGVDVDGNPVQNVFEAAEAIGKSTGVVTTVEISHATPAGFVAHNADRDNYPGIANEMIFESPVDLIMGAGNPWYNNDGQPVTVPNTFKYIGGEATWDALVAGTASSDADGDGDLDPWVLIQERAEFQSLMAGPTPSRVIGVAHAITTLQQARSNNPKAYPYDIPLNETVPTLSEMTLAAINILDEDPDGFALMIEGGAIDWASHANQPGRTIEEQIDFDQAVEAVVAWVEANSNWGETLLIITGDHETGYLLGSGSNPTWEPLINNGAGVLPGMAFYSGNHTNSLIGLYAKGDDARLFKSYVVGEDPVQGKYVDNTSIAQVIFTALNYSKK